MASTLNILLGNLGERLDEELLPAIYAAVSLPTGEIRAWLDDAGYAFVDRDTGRLPSDSDLDESAARLIAQNRDRATVLGAASGLGGAIAVPPEVLASLVQTLRLGQRLAVMHGIDPETDAGKLLLWRALAAAYEVEVPEGTLGMKVRDLPDLVRSQLPATRQATAWLTRQVVARTIATVAGRITRLIPGLGAGLAAYGARRRAHEMGLRMHAALRRAGEGDRFDLEGEENAVEVR